MKPYLSPVNEGERGLSFPNFNLYMQEVHPFQGEMINKEIWLH